MARSNTFLTILALGVASSACAGGDQGDTEKARQLILKTLEQKFSHNVQAFIEQRSPSGDSFQQVRVWISRDGKMRQFISAPLSEQGQEKIDDGKRIASFLPDKKVVMVQESSQVLPIDISRINLTVKNYGLSIGGTTQIAGIQATLVVAKPRNKGLETRRFYIDERTGFLLKMETIDASGRVRLGFRVLQVSYPSSISATTFKIDLDSYEGAKRVYARRSSIFNASKGDPSLGFNPVLPDELPLGFELQDAQVSIGEGYNSVVVRISDGLVRGTVFQYPLAVMNKFKPAAGTIFADSSDIRFVVIGEAPEPVLRRMLNTFLETARKGKELRAYYLGDQEPPERGTVTGRFSSSDNSSMSASGKDDMYVKSGLLDDPELWPGVPTLTRSKVQQIEIQLCAQFSTLSVE